MKQALSTVPLRDRLLLIGVILLLVGCGRSNDSADSLALKEVEVHPLSSEAIASVERFCGDCHALPLPETFPKANWQEEVRQGFQFYLDSKRSDLVEPLRRDAIRYFQDAAPQQIVVPHAESFVKVPTQIRFEAGPSISVGNKSSATAHLVWQPLHKSLLFTDMRHGTLFEWQPNSSDLTADMLHLGPDGQLASGRHICRVTPCDWNSDGLTDYLMGEMGSFPVGDHADGRVSLLLSEKSGSFQYLILAEQLGRTVSAVPVDYDEDGDLDIVVADFGWRQTGAFRLLRNGSVSDSEFKFKTETIDSRHGALGVEVADLNGDDKPDLVVAFAQEFESIEAFMNEGQGRYRREVLYALPDPSYNTSSFQVVDVDQDGKLDIVYTCGDTLDAFIAKPYHGLGWLRNLSDNQWEQRDLGMLIGALQSAVADLDGDGDLDIAGVGLFPTAGLESPGTYDAICIWEQRENLQFVRHSMERDQCNHAACTVADIDEDGRMDLVVGQWSDQDVTPAAFRVFWNKTPAAKDSRVTQAGTNN